MIREEFFNKILDYVTVKTEQEPHLLLDGGREISHIFCWQQGFITGMAGIAWQVSKNEQLLKWINDKFDQYYDKVHKYSFETMHDLGFLFSPYAVMMYKSTGDTKMRDLAVCAADVLAKRYVPNGHYIRAWGRMDNKIPSYVDEALSKDHFFQKGNGLSIVDSMMNMPLLFWAGKETGHPFYTQIAIEQVETTLKYFVRPDNSVYHAYRFDENGKPMHGENYCGYDKESKWARGMTWIIYGLAIAYGYTGNHKYLQESIKLFHKFIDLCGDNNIPMWDFALPKDMPALEANKKSDWDASDTANIDKARDTSAAAIAVCAAQKILTYTKDIAIENYSDQTLELLCNKYCDFNGGLLSHSNGMMSHTLYGDFYFFQAMAYAVMKIEACW